MTFRPTKPLHSGPIACDQVRRKRDDMQERVDDQAQDQPAAKLAVMEKGKSRKPCRQGQLGGGCAGRGLFSTLKAVSACLNAKKTINMMGVK